MILTKEYLHIMGNALYISGCKSEKIMHHLRHREDFWSICNVCRTWFTGVIFFSINRVSECVKKFFIAIAVIIHKADKNIFTCILIKIVQAFGDSILRHIEAF